jgi:L-alanine-DL-glutamate epimerase-like enolase superfamily enzyme
MATGSLAGAEHVLVRVRTDDGLVGIAEAVSRPMIYGESQQSIVAAIQNWIAPIIVGCDPFAVEDVAQRLSRVVNNNTAKGAIDIALHDLQGKALGVSCWRLLGAAQPHMSITCMLSMGDPQAMADEAVQLRDELGVTAFKVKIDADVNAAVASLNAIRAAVGDGPRIYVDANRSMRPEQVLHAMRRLADVDLYLFEDPTPIEDEAGRAALAARLDIPIMADETARTLGAAANELASGRVSAVSVKPARTGFTISRKIVGLAESRNAHTIMGSQGDASIGVAAALCFGAAHASTAAEGGELDFFRQLSDDIVTTRPTISEGRMTVPTDAPGIGAEVDEDKLRHYRVEL